MRETKTLIIGATALACGIASVLGEDCLIVERTYSSGGEFADAMMADSIDMNLKRAEKTALLIEEMKARHALSEQGEPHILGFAGAFAKRFNQYGCRVLLGASVVETVKNEDRFTVTVFIPDEGYSQISAERIINTEPQDFMQFKKHYSLLLAGGVPDVNSTDSPSLIKGYFDDEYILRFEVPADATIPTAQKIAHLWLEENREKLCGAKVAGISLAFGHSFSFKTDTVKDGIRYVPSASYPDVVSAFEGGELLCL